MKKSKLMLTLFLSGSLIASSLAGCSGGGGGTGGDTTAASTDSGNTTTAQTENTTAAAPTAGTDGVNLLLSAEPKTLDASKATDLYSSQILSNVMVTLTKPVYESESATAEVAKEDGAEKIDVSEDGLVWTFHLRQNIKWSDGQPVKAQDYVYSIQRTLDPNTASQYAYLLYPVKGAQEMFEAKLPLEEAKQNLGVVAKDDNTLEITLKAPCAYYKQTTYFKVYAPMRQDFIEKCGETYGADADKLLYCGPYSIAEWKHKDTVTLQKNPEYWDAASYPLEKINFRIIEDTDTSYSELEAGGIAQMNYIRSPEWDAKFKERTDMTNLKAEEPSNTYLLFNEDARYNSVMKNLKLRQAVSAALNREEACQELYGGIAASPAYDWVGTVFNLEPNLNYRQIAGESPIKKLQAQVTDPKATLIEGMKELGLGEDPSALELKYYQSSASKAFAEYFQAQLQEALGCKITLDLSEWAQYQEKVNRYEHDIAAQSWSADYNDPMTMFDMFLANTEQSGTGMANAKFDELVQKAGSLPAEQNEERIKLFAEAENILLVDECAVAPWAHRTKNAYYYNYLKGYKPHTFGSFNLMGLSAE